MVQGRRKIYNFFLNLEKRHAQESFITSLYGKGELINDNAGIERKIVDFYSNLYQEKNNLLTSCIANFLQSTNPPILKEQETKNLEQPLFKRNFNLPCGICQMKSHQEMMALQKSFIKHFGTI